MVWFNYLWCDSELLHSEWLESLRIFDITDARKVLQHNRHLWLFCPHFLHYADCKEMAGWGGQSVSEGIGFGWGDGLLSRWVRLQQQRKLLGKGLWRDKQWYSHSRQPCWSVLLFLLWKPALPSQVTNEVLIALLGDHESILICDFNSCFIDFKGIYICAWQSIYFLFLSAAVR